MNLFNHICPVCGTVYQDVVERGKTKLVHFGLLSTADESKLPSPDCTPYHDYVNFTPCNHCCPDVFAECRACKLGYPGALPKSGQPTEIECECHYCVTLEVTYDAEDRMIVSDTKDFADLFLNLKNHFDKSELKNLLFIMGIDIGNFPEKKDDLIREFILYISRSDKMDELREKGKMLRPELAWEW